MKSRLIVAGVCVPLLFVVMFFLPPIGISIVTAVICAVAAWELLHATGSAANIRVYIYACLFAAAIPLSVCFGVGELVLPASALLLMALMFVEAIAAFGGEKKLPFTQIATVMFAGIVIPCFLASIVALKTPENGRLYVLLPFLAAFVPDGGAYFAGVYLGRHKAFPHVSPKKTVEGCIGGLLSGVIIMLLYALILKLCKIEVSFLYMAIYGLVGAVFTELGDLAFSLVKREYGIKDYGTILREHGGILDRFDSMVFAAPLILLLTRVIPAF